MELFDTHVHLDAEAYAADLPAVLDRARAVGVTRFVTIGAGYGTQSMEHAVRIAEQHPDVWCSIGLHPHDASEPLDLPRMRDLAQHPKVVAIGETGLDYFKNFAARADQISRFRSQVELACEVKKPLIIHSRDAGEDCLSILDSMGAECVGGVFHCFAENANFAERLVPLRFLVSIPGNVTFKKNEAFRDTVRAIPLAQIMLETDGPFLAPEPLRGRRCESAFMVHTASTVAAIKGVSVEQLAQVTTHTALTFFNIS